ncbi:MAG TPA: phospholipid carrier-dependent glycosyltransferase [Polyangia bacterium]|nr:phospholipid carrier-dependent glycosyltransferase [Polyangia bacterium]
MIRLVLAIAGLAASGLTLARLGTAAPQSRATAWVRAGLWAMALLVVTQGLLGALGHLATTPLVVTALGVVAVALRCGRRRWFAAPAPSDAPVTATDVGLGAALAGGLALRLQAGLHRSFFLYDTLSYHLHVPASWLAAGRLQIVPAVFGDPSSAYAPSNLELWFAFLMAPLRSDYLAAVGQLPFAALGALAVAASVREAGARREAALGSALAFLLVPEVWQQARTAMTDLGMAALLVAAIPFLIRLRRGVRAADLLALAAALGLGVGTKYAAAPLALPFFGAAAWLLVRPRPRLGPLAAAAAVVIATGGFWYLRNLIVTGNPWYPVATLGLPGLYGRAAMRAWDYHLPIGDLSTLGELVTAAGFGFSAAALVAFVRVRPALELALAAAVTAIFWLVVPYQESRFLLPAFGLAAVAIGRAAVQPPAALGWGGLGLALIGEAVALPSPDRLALLPIGMLGAAAMHGWRRIPQRARPPLGWALAGAAGLLLVAGLGRGLAAHRRSGDTVHLGGELDDAWVWFGANVRGARVAYTGTNLAFPLWGPDLANPVTYVNVAGAPGDRLHDFPARPASTPEPAPYRDGASYDVWLRNLRAARAQVLFVAALDPIVARTVTADREQFPIERQWADAHPELFHLRYASNAARVYGIDPP